MADVAATVERMQGGGANGWFGHPNRVPLTVRGEVPRTATELKREPEREPSLSS